ncbi:acyl-CoA dehydrogenase family protein [Spirillospora albida]|uniref:acyl-CoA dehydrogenase family protein n=1 Tax=Spirillospora albida TaxID=58123 RepID=UPI000690EF91|nr:acyl-CoA dehydrogenase family protein [Spirillospora albida]
MAQGAETFLSILESGRLGPGSLQPFPSPGRAAEPDLAAEMTALARERIDPDELDRTGAFPPGLLDTMRDRGYFRLRLPAPAGHGLSDYAAFHAISEVSAWSPATGQFLAIQNAVGAAALLAALPPGPLHDHVAARVRAGTVSAFAGTEEAGANNAWPRTTATPTPDGEHYVLSGTKLYTGSGSFADLLALTVTIAGAGGDRRVGVAFVDTDAPGLQVTAQHEFLGQRGLGNARLRLDGVRVPRDHVLAGEPGASSFPAAVIPVALLSALYFNAAPALGLARACLRLVHAFVPGRTVNDRPLGDYDAVQRITADLLADVYAMESLTRWCLLGPGASARTLERVVAKNVCTRAAWRVADDTVSLLGARGLETAASQARRGALPVLPAERLLRDARGMRVSGNVDFILDVNAGRLIMSRFLTDGAAPVEAGPAGDALADDVRRFTATCADLAARHPDPADLMERQGTLGALGRIAAELLTAAVVRARATAEHSGGELAALYGAAARARLAALWTRLDTVTGDAASGRAAHDHTAHDHTAPDLAAPDHVKVSRRWLDGAADPFTDPGGDRP